MKVMLPYGQDKEIPVEIPDENLFFTVGRGKMKALTDPEGAIRRSIKEAFAQFKTMTQEGKIVILVDDLTRPTPQNVILPLLVDELSKRNAQKRNMRVIIALGTHREMTEQEIKGRYGDTIMEQLAIVNHEWKDDSASVDMGKTESGIPITVNKAVHDADFVVGVSNIAPHNFAGWGGGGKIVLPGVCGEETTGMTHVAGGKVRPIMKLAGNIENDVRREIDEVAKRVGLSLIVNTILNEQDKIAGVVAGVPIQAFRSGVKIAEDVYRPRIPGLADVVVFSTYPADIDYWQAMKALDFACTAVKTGGTIVFIAPCPERISPTHPTFKDRARQSFDEHVRAIARSEIEDLPVGGALLQHSQILEHANIICYSEGLTNSDKEALGFVDASTPEEAVDMALRGHGRKAKIGVLKCGEIVPRV